MHLIGGPPREGAFREADTESTGVSPGSAKRWRRVPRIRGPRDRAMGNAGLRGPFHLIHGRGLFLACPPSSQAISPLRRRHADTSRPHARMTKLDLDCGMAREQRIQRACKVFSRPERRAPSPPSPTHNPRMSRSPSSHGELRDGGPEIYVIANRPHVRIADKGYGYRGFTSAQACSARSGRLRGSWPRRWCRDGRHPAPGAADRRCPRRGCGPADTRPARADRRRACWPR